MNTSLPASRAGGHQHPHSRGRRASRRPPTWWERLLSRVRGWVTRPRIKPGDDLEKEEEAIEALRALAPSPQGFHRQMRPFLQAAPARADLLAMFRLGKGVAPTRTVFEPVLLPREGDAGAHEQKGDTAPSPPCEAPPLQAEDQAQAAVEHPLPSAGQEGDTAPSSPQPLPTFPPPPRFVLPTDLQTGELRHALQKALPECGGDIRAAIQLAFVKVNRQHSGAGWTHVVPHPSPHFQQEAPPGMTGPRVVSGRLALPFEMERVVPPMIGLPIALSGRAAHDDGRDHEPARVPDQHAPREGGFPVDAQDGTQQSKEAAAAPTCASDALARRRQTVGEDDWLNSEDLAVPPGAFEEADGVDPEATGQAPIPQATPAMLRLWKLAGDSRERVPLPGGQDSLLVHIPPRPSVRMRSDSAGVHFISSPDGHGEDRRRRGADGEEGEKDDNDGDSSAPGHAT